MKIKKTKIVEIHLYLLVNKLFNNGAIYISGISCDNRGIITDNNNYFYYFNDYNDNSITELIGYYSDSQKYTFSDQLKCIQNSIGVLDNHRIVIITFIHSLYTILGDVS